MKGNWNDEQMADRLRCLRHAWLRELENDAGINSNGYSDTTSNLLPKDKARRASFRLRMSQALTQISEAIDVLERPPVVAPFPEEEEDAE